LLVFSGCNNASEGGNSLRDGEYTVEFTRESYEGEDLTAISQREVRVSSSNGRLDDFVIVAYDENDEILNFVRTADYGEKIGSAARIRDPEYDAMVRWEIYEREQEIEWGRDIDATPLASGTK
jgi:hypothetical protein